MRSIRKFGVALALAGVMAVAAGNPGLEAKGKKSNPDSKEAICSYLLAVMTYEAVSPYVYVYAASLYSYYGCTAQ
jgi:hypothetical protein